MCRKKERERDREEIGARDVLHAYNEHLQALYSIPRVCKIFLRRAKYLVNILAFLSYKVSFMSTQLCCHSTKSVTE